MSFFLSLILWVIVIAALLCMHAVFWSGYFASVRMGDEIHFVTTEDGWRLALHHYVPVEPRYRQPVLLIPGIACNRTIFDLNDERSLARDLSGRGFDVWIAEPRGMGLSARAGWKAYFLDDYDFDDILSKDIAAVIGWLRKKTGGESVWWVGHSLGGLLGYAWLGRRGEHGLAGLVTVSSPVHLARSLELAPWMSLSKGMRLGKAVMLRPIARFVSPLAGWSDRFVSSLVVWPESIESSLKRRILVNTIENIPQGLMEQIRYWHWSGRFTSRDREVDYYLKMNQIVEPLLIISPERDRVAPPAAVAPAYQQAASKDKQFRIIGTDSGDDHDFGHGDILVGRYSQELVFAEIADWLEARVIAREG